MNDVIAAAAYRLRNMHAYRSFTEKSGSIAPAVTQTPRAHGSLKKCNQIHAVSSVCYWMINHVTNSIHGNVTWYLTIGVHSVYMRTESLPTLTSISLRGINHRRNACTPTQLPVRGFFLLCAHVPVQRTRLGTTLCNVHIAHAPFTSISFDVCDAAMISGRNIRSRASFCKLATPI